MKDDEADKEALLFHQNARWIALSERDVRTNAEALTLFSAWHFSSSQFAAFGRNHLPTPSERPFHLLPLAKQLGRQD